MFLAALSRFTLLRVRYLTKMMLGNMCQHYICCKFGGRCNQTIIIIIIIIIVVVVVVVVIIIIVIIVIIIIVVVVVVIIIIIILIIIIIISAVHAAAGRWPPQLTPCTSILSHPHPLTATNFLHVVSPSPFGSPSYSFSFSGCPF